MDEYIDRQIQIQMDRQMDRQVNRCKHGKYIWIDRLIDS